MKKIILLKTELYVFYAIFVGFVLLSFGFGYFIGRYEQIQINRSSLQTIPDVNEGKD